MAIVTLLFFMWGLLTALNDILVPHLKAIFDLKYVEVMLIQLSFFSAYFLFAMPSGRLIECVGYKRTMVLGLIIMGAGALLFIPAAGMPSFPLFLIALIVLGAGNHCAAGIGESVCCGPGPSPPAHLECFEGH